MEESYGGGKQGGGRIMSGWGVVHRYDMTGKPFGWGRDFPGKGYGSIKRLGPLSRPGRYYWSVEVDMGEDVDMFLADVGEAESFTEAGAAVESQFELVEAL